MIYVLTRKTYYKINYNIYTCLLCITTDFTRTKTLNTIIKVFLFLYLTFFLYEQMNKYEIYKITSTRDFNHV